MKNLPYGQLNAYVKNHCRKSCKNCVGTFIIYLKKCHFISQYLLEVSIINYSDAKNTSLSYFSAEARTRNIPEIRNEEMEWNVADTLTESNKYNINGN